MLSRFWAWLKADKPWTRKIGLHQCYYDVVGDNYGTDEHPIYFTHTYLSCNYCPWRELQ